MCHGGELGRIDLDQVDLGADRASDELLALNEARDRPAVEAPEVAEVAKLRSFAGLSIEQAADAMSISVRTANRHRAYAHAWLDQQLNPGDETNDQKV